MWAKLINKTGNNDNNAEISFIDVKELYDAAYAEKAKPQVNLDQFSRLMDQAYQLDLAYRVQLAINAAKPFEYQTAA